MSRTTPLARWLLLVSVLSGILFACAGRIHAPIIAAYLAVFAGTGLATAVLTDASQDDERRKPGLEEMHPNSRRGATALFLLVKSVLQAMMKMPVSGTLTKPFRKLSR
ncbi:MAG: hypothetical protein ACRD3O_02935 [Terriglobia bacterium]